MQKAHVLAAAGDLIANNRISDAEELVHTEYPFEAYVKPKAKKKASKSTNVKDASINPVERKYTQKEALQLYIADGFVDRYFGVQLVCPSALYALSKYIPNAFPCGENRATTHQAFWDLFPSLDHLDPVSLGGADNPRNWVTTSMSLNLKKSNLSLDELGWSLQTPDETSTWDGMMGWYQSLSNNDSNLGNILYNKAWHQATIQQAA